MSRLLIRGGHVIDPANRREGTFDVLIEDGKIAEVKPSLKVNGAIGVDASNQTVIPGLIDLHAHLREPGREDKETIESGTRAALRGGFTTICAMPNTEPAIDHRAVVDQVSQQSQRCGAACVRVIGAITKGRAGHQLTDFGELFESGCVALSDDGNALADSFLMRRALEYAKLFDRPIIQHAEDPRLAAGGMMHEGIIATMLGLRGIPAAAEEVIVARDLALAALSGGWIHFAHLSSGRSVELIRQAKRRGVRVSCEVTPHHLALTHEAVGAFDTSAKVNPPLRTEEDRLALVEGLRDGTIDCIATDHAPHTDWEKASDFESAPFGTSALETALSVCIETLVKPDLMRLAKVIEKLSVAPARIAGLEAGTLSVGADADLTLIDPDASWMVDPRQFVSKGRHSPFAARKLPCVVTQVFRRGTRVYPY